MNYGLEFVGAGLQVRPVLPQVHLSCQIFRDFICMIYFDVAKETCSSDMEIVMFFSVSNSLKTLKPFFSIKCFWPTKRVPDQTPLIWHNPHVFYPWRIKKKLYDFYHMFLSEKDENRSRSTKVTKGGASVQENYRKTAEVVRPCEENERGAHSEKNARCGHTREKKKRAAKT